LPADVTRSESSFVEILRRRARRAPDATAFIFEGVDGESRLTYAELDRRARGIAAELQGVHADGQHVLLVHPPGLGYVAAVFGCLYAGTVAVPAYPPDPTRLERTLPRLLAVLRDANARAVLTTTDIRTYLGDRLRGTPEVRAAAWLATDSEVDETGDGWRPPALGPDDVALLQYTSGSTASPRGVMLTHANLLSNSEFIRGAFGHSAASRGVSWLPPYHDMGLIGGVLQPVYAGFPCVLMSPLTFLRRPVRWLRAVSDHRATGSGGPNFAFDLCVRRIDAGQRAELDLSSWEVAFNGAEPVAHETIDAFSEAFAGCGFRREAFFPCYGLAEATLMVTGGPRLRSPAIRHVDSAALAERGTAAIATEGCQTKSVVGCGRPDRDDRVVITDPVSYTPLPEGRVGEVWVSGPSVGAGYWKRPQDTEATFGAVLAGTRAGRFLRTGDLGFVLEGELFVTGRIKDLLIVAGANHYPRDLELACEKAAPGVRPGCGAAFTLEGGGRARIAIVYEVAGDRSQDHEATICAIRQAVAAAIGVQVHTVVLTRPRTIPKTSSGKVQRLLCRSMLVDGKLDAVAAWSLERRGQ
jgi:acyl-CoA synthetase (AMP-forming)/AMP-acid ligase II